ncbi:hypothetical protein Pnap_4971 (plasmid) [Polaromonas naphthalenivorans CJ2]|uniref:Uncharacterized protein n=2 Tax=Polaromonas naphthalenivorans TaxID=216465 RepID=A1VWK4_POLNA|nr:hypothetical protein Pnap_4971 [Polaromonas naphthalenivorans CJ2]
MMAKTNSVHKPSIPVRTVAHVYSDTAKAGKGQVPKGSFAAGVAKLATQHKPQAQKSGFAMAKPTSGHKLSIPVRTVAQVYSDTAKAGKGHVPKSSFASEVASLATQHKPQAPKGR